MVINKKKLMFEVRNYILVLLGTFLLAFGTVIFLTKAELVAGGISGIAIIVQHFFPDVQFYDYLVAGLTIAFWVLGLIFVDKNFAFKTAFSSLIYIGFTFLFVRVPLFTKLANNFYGSGSAGELILCALFGGVFIGGGVAITFVGGGSTGGVDVIQFICKKYLNIRQSITSFVVDALIIIVGMGVMQMWKEALCGILSAFVTALLIEFMFMKSQTSYVVDIISSKWEEISKFAQDELGRGATIIPAKGGYKGEDRPILRIVFDRPQYEEIRNYIAHVDPHAFLTFTTTNAVYGEGFTTNKKKIKIGKTNKNK